MENIIAKDGYDAITNVEKTKEEIQLEKNLQAQKQTLGVTVKKEHKGKLAFAFKTAQERAAQILLHKEVEKDIEKAKENYHYGNFFG